MMHQSFHTNPCFPLLSVLRGRPQAVALLKGSAAYPNIEGSVRLYQTNAGVILYAEVQNLPTSEFPCGSRIFGFHIHEGESCSGDESDPFSAAMAHYNPGRCPHPHHGGDLPPLFENNGFALMLFLTDRFSVREVFGNSFIIQNNPDDFTTQPSGNSGSKIACGIIQRPYQCC